MKFRKLLMSTIMLFMMQFGLYSETSIEEVDFNDPASVVRYACYLVTNSDYENMINITESGEKKRTLEALDLIKKDLTILQKIKKDASFILKFDIIDKEIYNKEGKEFAVVYTIWEMKTDIKIQKNAITITKEDYDNIRKSYYVYVDYLLKRYDGKWKIVSRKSDQLY